MNDDRSPLTPEEIAAVRDELKAVLTPENIARVRGLVSDVERARVRIYRWRIAWLVVSLILLASYLVTLGVGLSQL